MYNFIWKKYLPIIRILMKKSIAEEQVLALNKIDFERAGTGRKAGYKFKIELVEDKVGNVISGSALAMQLAETILEDEAAKQIIEEHNFDIALNTKFELTITNVSK